MRRSIYDNSYNRNRVRIDGRDSGNWASRIGVRSQHKDMRGRVIGGIAADGTAFGTKERGGMEPPMPNFTPAPAPAQAVQRPTTGPAPAPATKTTTQPKTAPRHSAMEVSIPKADPLRAKLFPDRAKPTPENKLTPQIATKTLGERTSNINRLTGKPMGWRPGDDAPDAAVAAKPAAPKTNIEPMGPPASAKQAPAWASKGSPVAPSPTKQSTPTIEIPKGTAIADMQPGQTFTPSASLRDRIKREQAAKYGTPTQTSAPAPVKQSPITVGGTPVRTENYGSGAQPAPKPTIAKNTGGPTVGGIEVRTENYGKPPVNKPTEQPDVTATAMNMDRLRRPASPLKSAATRSTMAWQDRVR